MARNREDSTASALNSPVHPTVRRNTLLLTGSQAFSSTAGQMIPTLGAIMIAIMTGSANLAGIGTSILGISRMLVSYAIGKLTDVYGRRVGLVLGYVVVLVGAVVTGLSMVWSSFLLVILGMLIFGFGLAAGQQVRVAVADMYPPTQRGQALGLVFTVPLVGAVTSPMLIGLAQILSVNINMEPVALSWVLVPLFVAPGLVLILGVRPDPMAIALRLQDYFPGYTPEAPELRDTVGPGNVSMLTFTRDYLKSTAFVAYAAAQGTMAMMMALTALILSGHDYGLTAISLTVSVHTLGMFGFSLGLGRISDSVGRKPVMIVGIVVTGIGAVLIPMTSSYWIITFGLFLVGLGWSCVNVGAIALLGDTSRPNERGRVIGTNDTISAAASIALPILAGPMAQAFGFVSVGLLGLFLMPVPLFMLFRIHESTPGKYFQGHQSI